MPEVILITDPDCPNVEDTRTNLLRAFATTGLRPTFREIDRSAPDTPLEFNHYGSPTILVNGRDVAGTQSDSDGNCCRVYRTESGRFAGVPSVEQIVDALVDSGATQDFCTATGAGNIRGPWKGSLSVLPAIGIALLPSVTCPACWPAYAAILSSLGIGFLPSNKYLFPLTAIAVLFALAMLAWQARKHRRAGPLVLATLGAAVLLVGRFSLQSDPALYTGVGLLIFGSTWNAWPARLAAASTQQAACPACKTSTPEDSGHGTTYT